MAGVLDPPMAAYPFIPLFGRWAAERGHPKDDLACLPAKPGFGVSFANRPLQPQNSIDQLLPRRASKPRLGRKHRQFAHLPAITAFGLVCRGAAWLAPHKSKFEPAAQFRLVVSDLREQMIARSDHASVGFF